MNRFIITTTEIEKKEYRIAALCDARQKLIEVTTESMTGTSVLGNIYIGRVENVVKNLNAAFVCIAPGQNCYLPLQELKNPVFLRYPPNLILSFEKSGFYQKTIRKKSNLCRG